MRLGFNTLLLSIIYPFFRFQLSVLVLLPETPGGALRLLLCSRTFLGDAPSRYCTTAQFGHS
jgi:hypothetical protein